MFSILCLQNYILTCNNARKSFFFCIFALEYDQEEF
jgi:hypothetical protein